VTEPASPIRGFHHLAIQVRDLAAVEPFYRDVLGLPVIRRWPAASGVGERSVWLDTGDGHGFLALELIAPEGDAEGVGGGRAGSPSRAAEDESRTTRPGLHLVALRIERESRDAWEARLSAAGMPVESRTAFTLYVRDPEGNRVGLSHWPQAAGA